MTPRTALGGPAAWTGTSLREEDYIWHWTPAEARALIAAIESGKLAAAGLDVFAGEPAIDERYRTLKNTFLLPHIGSATLGTRSAMGMRAVDNLDAFFAGKTPGDLVTAG